MAATERWAKITAPEVGEFEGKPTLAIPLDSGKPFKFGAAKAAAIVKHIDAIRGFSAEHPYVADQSRAVKAAETLSDDVLLTLLKARQLVRKAA